jgi:hypothetical protein
VEEADLGHIAWVKPQSDRFSNVRRQGCRNVAETLEVNAINPHLGRLGHLNQQQIQ